MSRSAAAVSLALAALVAAKDGDGERCAGLPQRVKAEELVGLGNGHFGRHDWDAALECYRLAETRGAAEKAHNTVRTAAVNVGLVAAARGDAAEALAVCEPLAAGGSEYSQAHYCVGVGRLGVGDTAGAVEALEKAIGLGAGDSAKQAASQAHHRLAEDRLHSGRLREALSSAEAAVKLAPKMGAAHKTRGYALRHLGLHAEAVNAFRNAVTVAPEDPEAHANLGLVLSALGSPGAEKAFRAALAITPSFTAARTALGKLYHGMHRPELALKEYREVLRHDPKNEDGRYALAQAAADVCEWRGRDALVRSVHAAATVAAASGERPSLTPFDALTGIPGSLDEVRALAEAYADKATREVRHLRRSQTAALKPPPRGGPLRVGYYSSDFGNHPVGRLIAAMPEAHTPLVRPTLYALNADDGSRWRERAAVGARSVRGSVVPLGNLTNEAAAQKMAADGTHILLDLMGFTAAGFAMAREHTLALRPAPIVVGVVGYPGTAGVSWGEAGKGGGYYAAVDAAIVPPTLARGFSEKLLLLPHSYQVNSLRSDAPMYEQARAKANRPAPTREREGLPVDAFVWAHFNTLRKVEPTVMDLWASILHRTPGSVLWLLRMPAAAAGPLRREAAARGVDPKRLVFGEPQSPDDHLARCALADAFLDSLHYNAHTTATDALWAGLPIVTLPGGQMQGRVAAGLALAAGVPELVVSSMEEYVDLAVRLYGP